MDESEQRTDLLEILTRESNRTRQVQQDQDQIDSLQVQTEWDEVEEVEASSRRVSIQGTVRAQTLGFISGQLTVTAGLVSLESSPGDSTRGAP